LFWLGIGLDKAVEPLPEEDTTHYGICPKDLVHIDFHMSSDIPNDVLAAVE
jgi:hypothetical protein